MVCESFKVVNRVYLGHDNSIVLIPYADVVAGELYDMTDVTKVTVSADLVSSTTTGDDVSASSDDVPQTISWAVQSDGVTWHISISLGLFPGIAAGEYKLRVVLFEADYPNGLVLTDDLLVTVVGVP